MYKNAHIHKHKNLYPKVMKYLICILNQVNKIGAKTSKAFVMEGLQYTISSLQNSPAKPLLMVKN